MSVMSVPESSKSKRSKFSSTRAAGHRLREHDVAALQVPAQRDLGRASCRGSRRSARSSGRRAPCPARSATRPRWRCRARRRTRAPRRWRGRGAPRSGSPPASRWSRRGCRRRWGGWKFETPIALTRPDCVDLLHRLPGLDEVADAGQRPVHQEQVEVVDVEVLEGPVEGAERVVVRVEAVVQLAGDEDRRRGRCRRRGPPRRPPSRCRTSRRCRCAGSRPRGPRASRPWSSRARSGRPRSRAAGSRRRC